MPFSSILYFPEKTQSHNYHNSGASFAEKQFSRVKIQDQFFFPVCCFGIISSWIYLASHAFHTFHFKINHKCLQREMAHKCILQVFVINIYIRSQTWQSTIDDDASSSRSSSCVFPNWVANHPSLILIPGVLNQFYLWYFSMPPS